MVRQVNTIAAIAALGMSLTAGACLAEQSFPTASTVATTASEQIGMANWYGETFDGRTTASGERFDMFRLTAASATLPLGTLVEVTNLENGRSVVVRINDRKAPPEGGVIVLSKAAATNLEMVMQDEGMVRVQSLDDKPKA